MSHGIQLFYYPAHALYHNKWNNVKSSHFIRHSTTKQQYANLTVLVGIGTVKSGTTSFRSLIHENVKQINVFDWRDVPRETHYFDKCTNCSFDAYLEALLSFYRDSKKDERKMILTEKCPTYVWNEGASFLLTLYAHQYDVKFWLLLRNPIKRYWSNIWMEESGRCIGSNLFWDCMFFKKQNQLFSENITDVNKMSERLLVSIKYYDKQYPSSNTLRQRLKIMDKEHRNYDIDEEEIVTLFNKVMYGEHGVFHRNKYMNPMLSCYYPMVILWNYYWKYWNQHDFFASDYEKYALYDKFKIIQAEQVFDNKESAKNTVIQQLYCWTVGETDLTKCDHWFNYTAASDARDGKSFSPKIKKVMDLTIGNSLKLFYNDCNQRLYWFLEKHPQFLLNGQTFQPWW